MVMKFNTELLAEWLDNNGPLAKEKLAVQAGVSFSLIQQLLKGERLPRSGNLMSLAAAIGVDPQVLVRWAEPKKGKRSA